MLLFNIFSKEEESSVHQKSIHPSEPEDETPNSRDPDNDTQQCEGKYIPCTCCTVENLVEF